MMRVLPLPCAALCVLSLLWAANPALGDERATNGKSTQKHREAFESGSAHFDLNEYSEALEKFKEAYRLRPDPALLYNIARCHHKLDNRAEALSFYKKYLAKTRGGQGAANEEQVKKWIAELEGKATPASLTPSAPVPKPTPAPAPLAARRAVVFALSPPGDLSLARQFREAMELALTQNGRTVVPFQTISGPDSDVLSRRPAPGDQGWRKTAGRLGLHEVAICRLHNAGLLRGLARPQYQIDVELLDGTGSSRRTFKVELPNRVIDKGVREALGRALK